MPDFDIDAVLSAEPNTVFRYMYRDANNWKTTRELILSGNVAEDAFVPFLDDLEFFIPHDVGLEELQEVHRGGELDPETDHVWHEVVDVSPTAEPVTEDFSVEELLARFREASSTGWNLDAACDRLGL